MNEKNHEKSSYAEYEELVDQSIFGNPYSQDSIIWKDKYVVKQGLELLWYAKRFTLSCGERKYVYLNYEIRHKLMRLEVADVETALRCISTPPGCGRTRTCAVFLFLQLLFDEEAFDRHHQEEMTMDDVKKMYVYGIENSVLESEAEYRCRLEDEERAEKSRLFREAIASLHKEVRNFQDHFEPKRVRERECLCRFFPLPNCIFRLGLEGGEILVYAYLMYCEDRKTYKCHPSYSTIGEAVGMSVNTVKKYVEGLEKKCLISTEPTTIRTKDGRVRNGSLLYTIRPIEEAIDYYDKVQMHELRLQQAMDNVRRAQEKYERKHGGSTA